MKQGKRHYAWLILVGVCLGQAASLGLSVANNIFYLPLMESLNVERSAVTLTTTFMSIGQLISLPFVSKLYEKFKARTIMVPCCIVFVLCLIGMSFGTDIRIWYVISIFQGISSALAFTGIAPLILSNWFKTKFALAMGISSAVGSIAGVILNPVGSLMISAVGWRMTYRFVALFVALLIFPPALFIFKYKPSEMGMIPFGAEGFEGEDLDQAGVTPTHCTKNNYLFFIAGLIILMCVSSWVPGYFSHLPGFAVSIGLTATIGSVMTSFEIAGTTVSKLLIGPIMDKIGQRKSAILIASFSTVGFIIYLLNINMRFGLAAFYICSFMVGIFMPTISIITPVITREILGTKKYVRIQPILSAITTVFSSFSQTIYALVIDSSFGFKGVFVFALALSIISCTLIQVVKICENRSVKQIEAGAETI